MLQVLSMRLKQADSRRGEVTTMYLCRCATVAARSWLWRGTSLQGTTGGFACHTEHHMGLGSTKGGWLILLTEQQAANAQQACSTLTMPDDVVNRRPFAAFLLHPALPAGSQSQDLQAPGHFLKSLSQRRRQMGPPWVTHMAEQKDQHTTEDMAFRWVWDKGGCPGYWVLSSLVMQCTGSSCVCGWDRVGACRVWVEWGGVGQ
jgi:hypothetical protein